MTCQPRPLRGSRISTFYPVKALPSLASLDSAFQLQEYISLLIRLDVHDVDVITALPGKDPKPGDAEDTRDVAVDEACWIYEQLRRLAQDLTHPLITTLQQECSRSSCPEMKAGEWLYLCVAHGNDGATEQCCAIDYILHTLDSATALLNSPRAFPSRLQIPASSHRHFSSLARRLGRIFAHAYFHHREAFEQAEAESSLYARFLALTSKFDLVPSEFLVIPPSATTTVTTTGSSSTGVDDDDEFDDHGRGGGGYGLREAKMGTSYDPRRAMRQHPHQHREIAVDEFSRARHPQQQPQGFYEEGQSIQFQGPTPPSLSSGVDSPRKVGRNRTDTMVHSDMASVVDDLAKSAAAAAAAAKADEEENERKGREERDREGREREKAEAEEREKVEAEARAKAEAREEAEVDEDSDQEQEQTEDEVDGQAVEEDIGQRDPAPTAESLATVEDEHPILEDSKEEDDGQEIGEEPFTEIGLDTDAVSINEDGEEENELHTATETATAPMEEPVNKEQEQEKEQEKVESEVKEEVEVEAETEMEMETGAEAETGIEINIETIEVEEAEKPEAEVEEKSDGGD